MPSFVKSKSGKAVAFESIILPVGKIVAEHSSDEVVNPLLLAQSLGQENFTGYVLLRDPTRTRMGLIIIYKGKEAGTLLTIGRDSLSGVEAASRIALDHPAVSLSITAHSLPENLALAASSPFLGSRVYQRLPTAAIVLDALLDFWTDRKLTGMIWAGGRGDGVTAYFNKGEVLGEIEQGGTRLHQGIAKLGGLWTWADIKTEAFVGSGKEP